MQSEKNSANLESEEMLWQAYIRYLDEYLANLDKVKTCYEIEITWGNFSDSFRNLSKWILEGDWSSETFPLDLIPWIVSDEEVKRKTNYRIFNGKKISEICNERLEEHSLNAVMWTAQNNYTKGYILVSIETDTTEYCEISSFVFKNGYFKPNLLSSE